MVKKLGKDIEIDTTESYNTVLWKTDCDIIIPYINLLIINQVNDVISEDFIDYSYLIFRKVSSICKGSQPLYQAERTYKKRVVDHIMCCNGLNTNYSGTELKIEYEKSYLLFQVGFNLKKKYEGSWIPWETPFLKPNMDMEYVNLFFQKKSIPNEFYSLFGSLIRKNEVTEIEFTSPQSLSQEDSEDFY